MKYKMCLNMIVKNESHCIEETLECMVPYIDYYVICDTGSTDNTKEIIKKFFDGKGIKGEIYDHKWVNFGHNRTLSMQMAYRKSEYVWVMDADDLIVGKVVFPKKLTADSYLFTFGQNFTYERTLIFNNKLKWEYRGVLHEFASCMNKKKVYQEKLRGDWYIESRRLGDRNKDPEKYKKDALLLIDAINRKLDPDLYERYLFYTGQSWKDYGEYEKAIEWYEKRVNSGGWPEEVYYSILQIGYCMDKLNKPMEDIEKNYLKAFKMMYDRCEALYEFALICKRKELYDTSLKYLLLSSRIKYPQHYILFVNKYVYDFAVSFEICDICVKLNNKDLFLKYSDDLSRKQNLPDNIKSSLVKLKMVMLSNVYSNKVDVIKLIENKSICVSDEKNIIFTMTTCKRYELFEKTINTFLNCCMDKQLINKWYIVDDNSSNEDREKMKINYPFIEFVLKKEEEKGHAISMNMIKDYIIENGYKYQIHLEDDWMFYKQLNYIEDSLRLLNVENINFVEPNEVYKIEQYRDKKIKQVLFNKNYTEIEEEVYNGGYICKLDDNKLSSGLDTYILHDHIDDKKSEELAQVYKKKQDKYGIHCVYWPYFSFRPSLIDTSIYKQLGDFNKNGFFEMDYAKKYEMNDYISLFFNDITCRHIGKLTSDKSSKTLNAYELNNVDQGKGENKVNVIVVREKLVSVIDELEKDKKYKISKKMTKPPTKQSDIIKKYKKIVIDNSYIDDYELNNELEFLFRHNNFNYNKKVIYDIYKHYEIWGQLKRDYIYDTYLVYNKDNVIMDENFDIDKIINNINNDTKKESMNSFYMLDKECQIYIIRKEFIIDLLDYIETNGIHTNLLDLINNLDKELYKIDNTYNNSVMNNKIELLNNEYSYNYEFIPLYDSIGNDIGHIPNVPITRIYDIVDKVEEVICFNTLGYLKMSIQDELKKIDFFNNYNPNLLHKKDGIYIHKNRFIRHYKEKGKNVKINFEDYEFYENEIVKGDKVETLTHKMLYEMKNHCDKNIYYEAFTTNGEMLINCDITNKKPIEINKNNIWNGIFVKKKYTQKNKWDILQNVLIKKDTFEIFVDDKFNNDNYYIVELLEKTLGKCNITTNKNKVDLSKTHIILLDNYECIKNYDTIHNKPVIIFVSDMNYNDKVVSYNIDVLIKINSNINEEKDIKKFIKTKYNTRLININKIVNYYINDIENDICSDKNIVENKIIINQSDLENEEFIKKMLLYYKNDIKFEFNDIDINKIKNENMKYYINELNSDLKNTLNKNKLNLFKENTKYESYIQKNVLKEFKKVFYSN